MDTVYLIKFLSAFLYPMGLVTTFLILWILLKLLLRKWLARMSLMLAIVILMIFANPMVAGHLVYKLEKQFPPLTMDAVLPHDAIVVLGGGLRLPIEPSNRAQLGSAGDRYMYAFELFKANKASKLFLLGGNVYPQPSLLAEAEYAKQLLVSLGVPPEIIYVETSSRTTQENAENISQTLQLQGIDSALLVTSSLHMPRSFAWFSELDLVFTPAPADQLYRKAIVPSWRYWLPSSSALHLSTLAMHEYYGIWFSKLRRLVKH